jgi:hypothetical protein
MVAQATLRSIPFLYTFYPATLNITNHTYKRVVFVMSIEIGHAEGTPAKYLDHGEGFILCKPGGGIPFHFGKNLGSYSGLAKSTSA